MFIIYSEFLTTFLCPKPIRGASPCLAGSCYNCFVLVIFILSKYILVSCHARNDIRARGLDAVMAYQNALRDLRNFITDVRL